MNRFLPSKSLILLFPLVALACGSTGLVLSSPGDGGVDGRSPETTPDAASDGASDGAIADGGQPNDSSDANTCTPATPDAWAISAVDFTSYGCKTNSDCVAVYIGEDACEADPSHGPGCPNYAILATGYAAYQSRYQSINAACNAVCSVGSIFCPTVPVYCDKQGVAGPSCGVCPQSGCPDGGVGQ